MVDGATVGNIEDRECRLSAMLQQCFGVRLRASDFYVGPWARKIAAEYPVIELVERSIYELCYADDHADVIVCCEVLEHLPEPQRAMYL